MSTNVAKMLILFLVAVTSTACDLTLDAFHVPSNVVRGRVFEIVVTGTGTTNFPPCASGEAAALVLQLPVGFVVEGSWGVRKGVAVLPETFIPNVDDPNVLGLYTAEPGAFLTSFSDSRCPETYDLRVRVRAPVGLQTATLKIALAVMPFGAGWIPDDPMGATDFAQITDPAYVRTVNVVEATQVAAPFWLDYSDGLFFYDVTRRWAGIAFGDATGDGADDLVCAAENSGSGLYLVSGDPWTMPDPWAFGPGTFEAAFGHFNADGHLDVAVGYDAYFGSGGSAWQLASFSYCCESTGVATGDINQDGFDDVVVTTGSMAAFLSQGDGTWIQASTGLLQATTGQKVLLADVNADTFLDIVWTPQSGPGVWLGDGTGNWFQLSTPGLPAIETWGVDGADLDGDNDYDLIFGGHDDGTAQGPGLRLYRQTPGPNPTWAWDTASGLPNTGSYFDIALADFDDDGILDLVAGRNGGTTDFHTLELWKGLPGGLFAPAPPSMMTGFPVGGIGKPKGIAVGDANGDGAIDIGLASDSMGVAVWVQNRAALLDPCAAGTVGTDVLAINGSTGGIPRRVDVGIAQPITITVAQPVTNPNPANLAVFGMWGLPGAADLFATPFGDLCLTPAPVSPLDPALFTLANVWDPASGIVAPTLAPWSVTEPAGLAFPAVFTLQGIVVVNNQPTNNIAVTNGVILHVR